MMKIFLGIICEIVVRTFIIPDKEMDETVIPLIKHHIKKGT